MVCVVGILYRTFLQVVFGLLVYILSMSIADATIVLID